RRIRAEERRPQRAAAKRLRQGKLGQTRRLEADELVGGHDVRLDADRRARIEWADVGVPESNLIVQDGYLLASPGHAGHAPWFPFTICKKAQDRSWAFTHSLQLFVFPPGQ